MAIPGKVTSMMSRFHALAADRVRGLRDWRTSDRLSRGRLIPKAWKGKFPDVCVWDKLPIDEVIAAGGLAANVQIQSC
jgi:hypothetical protein